ncbi:thionin-like protein 2 [Cucurbita maxima]|uniref:Thionin-like protein 2 n=1 Tax=Cucurbita maxima TaxID=3661 RepID=A0A6J1KDK0_CUCMA|nr:thionin-like protein 2 [Cucurbita maxima]
MGLNRQCFNHLGFGKGSVYLRNTLSHSPKPQKARKMKSVVVICFILSLVAGRSTASFGKCYAKCFIVCAITPGVPIGTCGGKCLADCLFLASAPRDLNHLDTHYFCKLGCATSLCTKFSTKTDPAEKKVESCVNSCSRTCLKA